MSAMRIGILLCLIAVATGLVGCSVPEDHYLNIRVRDYGTMKVELFNRDAPRNVASVTGLADDGFYNGLTFHRLIPGFMIQGGDPNGDGTGGPGYTVPAEIRRKHERGSMAMARKGDQVNPERRSNGSQFYICFAHTPQLDGQYTVIGQVVDGWDVLDSIEKAATDSIDRPLAPIVMEQVFVTTD
jgi:peptidyl-prolyl cis-trans isomerase B (cyclophilin B)